VSETDISRAIRQALELRGFIVERIQAGSIPLMYGTTERWVHCASKGAPDLWCSVAGGAFIEVKQPGKKLSIDQQEWHKRAAKHGVRVACISSVKEALAQVRIWEQADR